MDEPLTSNDRPTSSGSRGICCFFGQGGSVASGQRDTLAARYGLLDVAEIRSKDLMTVGIYGAALVCVYLFAGIWWLTTSNEWTFTDTVYFMSTSLLTIGYGDVVVTRPERLLDSLLILLGLMATITLLTCASACLGSVCSRPVYGQGPVHEFDAELAIRKFRWSLVRRVLLLVVVIGVGVVAFMVGEDEEFSTSFYWVIVTSSTIGYGDVVPTTKSMRWFTSIYSIFATGAMFETLRAAGAYPVKVWTLRAEGKVFDQFTRAETPSERAEATALADSAVTELLGIPPEGRREGAISRSDMALTMLLLLNRVSYDDVQQAITIFDNLDFRGAAITSPYR